MYPVSREFEFALRGSHAIIVKAIAYRGGDVVPGGDDLNVAAGSVKVDYGSKIRRSLDGLKVASPDGSSDTLRDLLGVGGTELVIRRGIKFPSGRVETVPLGQFRIQDLADDLSQSGVVNVSANDISARVADHRFETGTPGTTGMLVVDQITALIQQTIPGALVLDSTGSTATVPAGVTWERERWDACTDLAAGIGAVCYADHEGIFRIEPVPVAGVPAVWTINPGRTGTLISGSRTSTRSGVFNVVVMSSNPTNGTLPVTMTAEDKNPLSPTFVGGPFGRVPVFRTTNTARLPDQVQAAADAYLARVIGRRGSLEVTTICNPALEAGDRIDIVMPEGGTAMHIAESFDISLTPGDAMTITTRAVEVLDEGDNKYELARHARP